MVAIRQGWEIHMMGLFLGVWSAIAVPFQPAPMAQAEPKHSSQAHLNYIYGAIVQELGEGLWAFFRMDLQAHARAAPAYEHIFPCRKSPS